MTPSRFNPLKIPDSVRFIDLQGVLYYIEWEKLMPGHSFFLKTPAHHRLVQKELKRAEAHFKIVLRARQRCEFGCYGVRVWRIS